jgi:hypothetical protein
MPRSEPPTTRQRLRQADWRGWLALAWVVWFGLLYGRMVVQQRGGKLRDLIRPAAQRMNGTKPAGG